MNGSIRLKTVENGRTYITHLSNLEELFPGSEFLSGKISALYQPSMRFFPPDFVFVKFGIFYGFAFINIEHYLVIY